jgi:hypothetical protein
LVIGVSPSAGQNNGRADHKRNFWKSDTVGFNITPTFRLRSSSYDPTSR